MIRDDFTLYIKLGNLILKRAYFIGEGYKSSAHLSIAIDTQTNKYVLATLTYDEKEGVYDLKTIGNRPFELNDEDYRDYCELTRVTMNMLNGSGIMELTNGS